MSKYTKRMLRKVLRFIVGFFNLGVPLKVVLLLLIIFTGTAIGITYSKTMNSVGGKEEYEEAKRYIELKNIIVDNYIGVADRDKMADSAAAAMVSGLSDKWSYYMSADEYNTYQQYSSDEYANIGMSLKKNDSGGFEVVSVNYDSAAAKAGLTPGMVIQSIDGVKVADMNIDDVRTIIRSKMNTSFELGLGGKNTITVDCSATYQSSVNYRLEKTMAGYVQIYDFEAGTAEDAIAAIEYLLFVDAESLVIDLRGNSGGLYSEAAVLLDYLLPNYDMFIEVDNAGKEKVFKSDGMCIDLPTVVMINGGTYGCAEIFAKVLQEYGKATILGEQSMGNVQAQETFDLEDGAAIRLSTKMYLTAMRTDISNIGVTPDIIIYNSDPSTAGTTLGTTGGQEGTSSTSEDEQLMEALRFLS
ncbi:MAG: PDZ domain-containing protein [Oscillospiraceae bacterium]|nr:PDZ domain-containing protein [Oscillospiraceae bacterium]